MSFILDEARMSAELMISKIQGANVEKVANALETITANSKLRILLGADIDVPTLQVLLPDCEFNDPKHCTIIDNKGGKGII